MDMTHYMELLATNQPWNLILFMAIPVILAETVAITELAILFRGNKNGAIGIISKIAGITGGLYFLAIFIYLCINVVVPLTTTGEWRGIVDMIAVGFYLISVVPLMGIALIDMHIIARSKNDRQKLKLHAIFVGIFLVVAHIAMIFGMLNPNLMSHKEGDHMIMKKDIMEMNTVKPETTETPKMQLKK